eukprot:symbB.v1.2.026432.t1/scaffold2640.1/size74283/2
MPTILVLCAKVVGTSGLLMDMGGEANSARVGGLMHIFSAISGSLSNVIVGYFLNTPSLGYTGVFILTTFLSLFGLAVQVTTGQVEIIQPGDCEDEALKRFVVVSSLVFFFPIFPWWQVKNEEELLQIATNIEGHPDNVAPCIYGGFQLGIHNGSRWWTDRVDMPHGLMCVVFCPDHASRASVLERLPCRRVGGSAQPMTTQPVETVDFLLSKAARLDKALKSLPKADRKTLHTSSHKRARRLLRNLSFPAKGGELTAEHIENRIDVLTTVKSAAASFAKKIPPLTDALTVGPDALAVRACALEAREGLAEDLCSEEISKTGASLDYVDALGLLADQRAQPWPDLKLFNEYYQTPPHLRLPKRSLLASESLPQLPSRNTIGGIEEATLQGNFPDLLPALIKSATGSLKVPEPKANTDPTLPAKRSGSKQNIFHATAVYRDACKRFKVKVLNTLPILGEMVELVGSNLEVITHLPTIY